MKPGLVIWFTGLPGSGKSTIARLLAKRVSHPCVLISMDAIRKKIYPKPTYSDIERDVSYRCFVLIASHLSYAGVTVILDGTGHKLVWRKLARTECPRFVEIFVKCPIEICIERETKRRDNSFVRKKLYEKALTRLRQGKRIRGMGKMPGIDESYEESPKPEIVLDSSSKAPRQLLKQVTEELSEYSPDLFMT
ncbi:MAG: adenylyl-sulfate kinase [Nitrososphaerota archaeon]|nr:adenylyl-sulfate kinase [Nitrososphaerota archaeon]